MTLNASHEFARLDNGMGYYAINGFIVAAQDDWCIQVCLIEEFPAYLRDHEYFHGIRWQDIPGMQILRPELVPGLL